MSCTILICSRLTSPWQRPGASEQQRLSGTFLTTDATWAGCYGNIRAYRLDPRGALGRPAQRLATARLVASATVTTVLNDSPVGLRV